MLAQCCLSLKNEETVVPSLTPCTSEPPYNPIPCMSATECVRESAPMPFCQAGPVGLSLYLTPCCWFRHLRWLTRRVTHWQRPKHMVRVCKCEMQDVQPVRTFHITVLPKGHTYMNMHSREWIFMYTIYIHVQFHSSKGKSSFGN